MHDDRRFAMVLLEKPCQSLADLIGIMGGIDVKVKDSGRRRRGCTKLVKRDDFFSQYPDISFVGLHAPADGNSGIFSKNRPYCFPNRREYDGFHFAVIIFNRDIAHGLSLLCHRALDAGNRSAYRHHPAVVLISFCRQMVKRRAGFELFLIGIQRMAADIKSQKFSFPFDFLFRVHIRKVRIDDRLRRFFSSEQVELPGCAFIPDRLRISKRFRKRRQKLRAVGSQGIQRAAADKAFTGAAVKSPVVCPFYEIRKRFERAALFPCFDDRTDSAFAHILYAIKAEENLIAFDGEISL